ncbi:MAG TPA: biopolymer transporter ExbD [Rhodanobacteraceae bacterium]|nr:biopolymer transporter ExbD [Rhodanobacteraceae bacterium]
MAAYRTAIRTVSAEMNITPLVDVMLVLLVIFMLAVPLKTHRLELESAPCVRDCPAPATPVNVSIKRTGEMYWNGVAINHAMLAANLAQIARQPNPPAVLVRPEARTHYVLVTDLLAAARNADVKIGLEPATP